MAASITIEQESGMCAGRIHPHNGYYAGDFTSRRGAIPAAWRTPTAAAYEEHKDLDVFPESTVLGLQRLDLSELLAGRSRTASASISAWTWGLESRPDPCGACVTG